MNHSHMNGRERLIVLDGVRGIVAVAVMIYHTTQHTVLKQPFSGRIAVDVFFCISGFVVAHAYLDRLRSGMTWRNFIARRFVRLYPMFLIGFCIGVVALLVKRAIGETDLDLSRVSVAALLNALYLPYLSRFTVDMANGRIPSAIFPTNDPAWSLFFECIANLIFLFVAFRCTFAITMVIAAGSAVWLAIYVADLRSFFPGWGYDNVIGGAPRALYGFFTGVAACLVFAAPGSPKPRLNPALIFAGLGMLFWLAGHDRIWQALALAAIPAFTYLAACCRLGADGAAYRSCDAVGWLSYPLYCVHFPVYSLCTSLAGDRAASYSVSLIACVVSVLVAAFAARTIEEPVRRWLGRRLTGHRDVPLMPRGERARNLADGQLP